MYEKEIEIPEGVQVEVESMKVEVSGAKGTLKRNFKGVFRIKLERVDNK